jgi:D-sedoheptulose 7-phosphate isomerase
MIAEHIRESIAVKQALLEMTKPIEQAAALWVEAIRSGGKILLCGNGGSAADAQHMAAELVGRLEKGTGGLPALALTTDTSIITALANDFGYDEVFAMQVRAHARPGDVLVGISTSGNSSNVVAALRAGRAAGARTVGMVGMQGGKMAELVDVLIRVPSPRTMRVQECHITIGHILCYAVEQAMLAPPAAGPGVAPVLG